MEKINYTYTRERLLPGFDGKFCKTCPCVATDSRGTVLISYQMLLLSGCDVVYDQYMILKAQTEERPSESRFYKARLRRQYKTESELFIMLTVSIIKSTKDGTASDTILIMKLTIPLYW